MTPRLSLVEGGAGAARSPARAFELMAIGAGLTLVMSLAGSLPSWRVELGPLQGLLLVAFAFYALALANLRRWRALPHAGVAVFVVALAMRAAVMRVEPVLSDDVYRYLWDGRVLAHGLDPYAHAPSDAALASLRDGLVHPRINHPGLRTIYPPLAEAGFALVATLAPGVLGMKLWIAGHDLALVGVLAWWCARRGGSPLPAIAYAWNPLVVAEYAGNAHYDPTGMLWLAVALALAEARPVLSALALSAAVLVRIVPVLALPFLLVAWPCWRARVLAITLVGAGLGAFALLARGHASGLEAYTMTWRNNELAFEYAARMLGERGARLLAAGVVAAIVVVLLTRRVRPEAGARQSLRSLLLAGPVLHPWYLGWALMFEPLALSPAWLLLSATALLNYGVFAAPAAGGAFHLPLAWRWLEYGLPLVLAVALALRARRARSQGGHRV